jgi:hypothetical protein
VRIHHQTQQKNRSEKPYYIKTISKFIFITHSVSEEIHISQGTGDKQDLMIIHSLTFKYVEYTPALLNLAHTCTESNILHISKENNTYMNAAESVALSSNNSSLHQQIQKSSKV